MLLIGATYIPSMDMGNLHVESNTISSSNTNGNIILNPNGSGNIQFPDLGTSNVPYLDASGYLASSSVTPSELGTLSGVTGNVRGIAQAATLTNKTIDADSNTISNIDNGEIKAAAGIALDKLAATTASRALVSDGSGFIGASATTSTELGYVSGVTSAIQTQINTLAVSSYFGAVYDLQNVGLAQSVSSNALTISLKQADGSTNPTSGVGAVKIGFRSATDTSGAFNLRSVTSALSLTISSGSTLGHTSGISWDIYFYALDNAGTVELAASSSLYNDGEIQSTTAEGGAGAADSYTGLYSATARSNVPIKLIGRLKINEATAGTWATSATKLEIAPLKLACTPATGGVGCVARYEANINCDAGSSVSGQIDPNYSWVSSVGNISSGQCTITLTGNAFSSTPFCTVNRNGQNATSIEFIQLNPSSATSVTMTCALISSGSSIIAADTACDATISCSGMK